MDRDLILSYLKAAEEHVANGERRIAKHCDLVSTLERAGHDTTSAIALLREMERMTRGFASGGGFVVRPMGAGECTTHKVCLVVLYRPHGR